MPRKPILCLDFDGVLHSYSSGWKGADVIPDPPVYGAMEFLTEAVNEFDVHIYSSRSGQEDGISAMREWLWRAILEHYRKIGMDLPISCSAELFRKITWPTEKPPAMVTIDDRALTFTGSWPSMRSLREFEPWNKPRGFNDAVRLDRIARAIWPCIGTDHTYDEALEDSEMYTSIGYCHELAQAAFSAV